MDLRWRGRARKVPDASEGIGEPRPDESLTVLAEADLVCERRPHDDVAGDDAARLVAAPEVTQARRELARQAGREWGCCYGSRLPSAWAMVWVRFLFIRAYSGLSAMRDSRVCTTPFVSKTATGTSSRSSVHRRPGS